MNNKQKKLLAERQYNQAKIEFEERFKAEEEVFERNLHNPDKNEALGLPRNLPEETIRILKFTQTLDKIGPQMPKVDEYYKKYGIN